MEFGVKKAEVEKSVANEEEEVLKLLINQRSNAKLDKVYESNKAQRSGNEVEVLSGNIMSKNDDTIGMTIYTPPAFDSVPSLIYEENFRTFTKGIKFANDGHSFAVCTDDNRIHVRKTVDLFYGRVIADAIRVHKVVTINEAQPIHDFAWHPNHEFCAFITTCNTQPLHLYCGQTGQFLCSYVARNHLDEHISAYSVKFNRTGDRVLAGFKKFIRIFDVECPGVWCEIATWKQYHAGIVSAIDTNGEHLMAVGTYCNTVALYDLRNKAMIHEPENGHQGGITQLRFSHDGNLLYSGARKDNVILCRDSRNFSKVLYEFPRKCTTNQRVYFDLPYEENYLATGNTDGTSFIWNLLNLNTLSGDGGKCRPNVVFAPHANIRLTRGSATNGLSFHPWAPVIATSSGGRGTAVWDEENERVVWESPYENLVKLWKFAQ
ncbi:hypothetical protein BIW11_05335 [Tropilaelaps mercedesae]|uniref:WD repeat-containing protein 79 n=1 Tax=Tropilaelaps mercedesae TaxID=418985 RepID=A0A1V9Y2W0_9ACAR|nr:hypothetical protein BIW11_05335 [Tropilaelaps mercedesae]OQR80035.1 hypothetical protein BIW11_05335 [Tropilaelaps mercedesae]